MKMYPSLESGICAILKVKTTAKCDFKRRDPNFIRNLLMFKPCT